MGTLAKFHALLWGWADYEPREWSGPPLSVEEQPSCFLVRDHNGQALAYIYFEEEPSRRLAAKLLTKAEARRIAANIAQLREALRR
jgi:hypothetical protein